MDSTLVDGGTEGLERGAEARSAGAPRGVGSGESGESVWPQTPLGELIAIAAVFKELN